MVVKKNIEDDVYLKLVSYAFEKCDSIFLSTKNPQSKSITKKVMQIIMQTNQYSENDILDKYSEDFEKFLEEMVDQFIDNDSIFDDEYCKKYEIDSQKCEEYKKLSRLYIIEDSIIGTVHELLTKQWLNKNRNNIIKTFDCYATRVSSGEEFLSRNIYYMKLTKDLQQEILSKNSIFDWHYPITLEDLCFFKDGYCWLYSEVNEKILNIYCENEEEYNYLKSIGVKFQINRFIPLSDKEKMHYTEIRKYLL